MDETLKIGIISVIAFGIGYYVAKNFSNIVTSGNSINVNGTVYHYKSPMTAQQAKDLITSKLNEDSKFHSGKNTPTEVQQLLNQLYQQA